MRLIDADALREKWLFRGEDGKPYRDEIDNAPTIEPPTKCIAQIKVDLEGVIKGVMKRIEDEYELKQEWIPVSEIPPPPEPYHSGEVTEMVKNCENCGTPKDKCVYCIEEDRMWTPQTERNE